jgi:hypothetical protein
MAPCRPLRRRSTERLALAGRCGRLDRVQHAIARDRVFKGGAEMRSLAIVASETRVRLGDVGGRPWALRRRPSILLWHGQDLERGLRAFAATCIHLEDLDLPAGGGEPLSSPLAATVGNLVQLRPPCCGGGSRVSGPLSPAVAGCRSHLTRMRLFNDRSSSDTHGESRTFPRPTAAI